jgi:quercetin dioxygenase-like cupin family protein
VEEIMVDQKPIVDRVASETFGAFQVTQITPDTDLEDVVGLDLLTIAAETKTEIHRHPHAENVIYILQGTATAIIGGVAHRATEGDRIRIGKGVSHGFQTANVPLTFVSVQSPPILNRKLNLLDTEVLAEP